MSKQNGTVSFSDRVAKKKQNYPKMENLAKPSPPQEPIEDKKKSLEPHKIQDEALSKAQIVELAKKYNLELKEKRNFIKHSYSVTFEHKEDFKKYCRVLGIKMQDAMFEMFESFFTEKKSEYEALIKASQIHRKP